ncbi:unnamed protein product [Didymodactylos carnosus]|uniref:Phosphatidic acid phosphatase type 2/haloperoxidase domain-containing protein n=1 Tax=Didymodactylos carnosus TaxID=1234261 RepID=A0A813U800_9BILA|nr:unnamed protein product [Didymodactylos carnosus]CAF0851511.1 unnamed protein product [Didymodactylos carnosus]CAF3610497.1 unnamed protein product [Didymodactylos carnosus]CAF3636714.1 unnamed protein product [Didymodactylos carnosus]
MMIFSNPPTSQTHVLEDYREENKRNLSGKNTNVSRSEYNPLYDTFQSTISPNFNGEQSLDFVESKQRRSPPNYRSLTPPPRFINHFHDSFNNTNALSPQNHRISDDTDHRLIRFNDHLQQQQELQPRSSKTNAKKTEPTNSTAASEVELLMDRDGMGGNEEIPKTGRRTRRRLLNNLLDFIAIVSTALIFGIIYLLVKPVQRGFYCDDKSIMYPFRDDTIPMWMLGIYGGICPVIIFFIVEIWVVRPFHCRRGSSNQSLKQRQVDYVKAIFHTVFLFGLGIAVCFLITEVGKRTIGRLRPYYLTVCNPTWSAITCSKNVTTASGAMLIPQYIWDHQCNPNVSLSILQEARLSFPSGHSSFATFSFIFLFVYFEARLVCPDIQFLKPFLQCLCVAIAFFTCLSRVTDNKHHPTDVIGGAIIGFSIAIFTAVRVGTYLWSLSVYCETNEETEKDQLPKEKRIPAPELDTENKKSENPNISEVQYHTKDTTATNRNVNRGNYDNVKPFSSKNHVTPYTPFPTSGGGNKISHKAFDEAPV